MEPLRDRLEGGCRRASVSSHFGGLTLDADTRPESDIFIDSLLDEA